MKNAFLLFYVLCCCLDHYSLSAQFLPIDPCLEGPAHRILAPLLLPSGNTLQFSSRQYDGEDSWVSDIVMLKMAPDGTCLDTQQVTWTRQLPKFERDMREFPHAALLDGDQVYLTIQVESAYDNDDKEVAMIRLDTSGAVQWRKILTNSGSFDIHRPVAEAIQLPNKNIVLPYFNAGIGSSNGLYLIIDSETGAELDFQGTSIFPNYLINNSDSTFMMALNSKIIEVDAYTYERRRELQIKLGPQSNPNIFNIRYIEPNAAGFLVFGSTCINNELFCRMTVVQLDPQGETVWFRIYEDMDLLDYVIANPEGGYLAVNRYSYKHPPTFPNDLDFVVAHLDANFDLAYRRYYRLREITTLTGLQELADGSLRLTGYTWGQGESYPFFWQPDSTCCVPPQVGTLGLHLRTNGDDLQLVFQPDHQFVLDSLSRITWHFGDGDSLVWLNNDQISHIYAEQGTYVLRVRVETACGNFSWEEPINVYCTNEWENQAPFTWTSNGTTVQLTNPANDWQSLAWTFGDGSTSTELNPNYQYAEAGTYEVCLAVANDCGVFRFCDSVEVLCGAVVLEWEPELLLCPEDSILVEAPLLYSAYEWSTGDTTAAIQLRDTGQYWLAVYNECGNSARDSFELEYFPIQIPLIQDLGDGLLQASEATSYQWYFDGQAIQDAIDREYQAEQYGEYVVMVLDEWGCLVRSEPFNWAKTGQIELVEASKWLLFPNPSRGDMHLLYQGQLAVEGHWSLWNIQGQKLMAGEQRHWLGQEIEGLELGHLPPGVYYLQVKTLNFYQNIPVILLP